MSERGESAKPTTPATIEKRDGRRVSFDRSRIESAVARAQAAVGEEDPSLAKEIAELVEYSLARRHAAAVHEGTPGIEEIQDLVERALIELGRAAVAKAYILYRDRRARARTLEPTQRERERAGSVSVADADGVERWDRARVAQALVSEAGLGRERAEEIAQRVEARVVASGLRRLTDTLVRELTIAELIAAGHAEAVRKQEPVSLSRREFERHLNGAFDTGAPVDRALGAAFFGRWARQEVLGERFLARHVEGSLHLVGEESIHGFSELAVPAEVLLPAAAGAKAPFQLLDEVAGLLPSLSRGVVIEGAASIFASLARARSGDATSPLFSWLLAARATARAAGRRIDLANLGRRSPAVFCRLAEELLRLDDTEGADLFTPRLYADLEELDGAAQHSPEIEPTLERLLERRLLIPTFGGEAEEVVGEVCRRRAQETGAIAVGGVVALDFARLARRVGPWREESALSSLSDLLMEALGGLATLAEWQRGHVPQRVGGVRVRARYTVAPVGLAEGLAILADGEVRPAQGARLLGVCAEAVRRFGMEHGVDTCMVTGGVEAAALRFAELGLADGGGSQPLLFERDGGEAVVDRGLSAGYGGALLEQGPAALAELLSTIRAGVLLEPHEQSACVDLNFLRAFSDERRRLRRQSAVGKDQPSSAAHDAALPFDVESSAPESLS